jgi:hypothetical protein
MVGDINVHLYYMSVGCRIMGDIMVYIVGYITTSVSLKGNKILF